MERIFSFFSPEDKLFSDSKIWKEKSGQTHHEVFAEKEAIKEKPSVIREVKSFDKPQFQICNFQCEMEVGVCIKSRHHLLRDTSWNIKRTLYAFVGFKRDLDVLSKDWCDVKISFCVLLEWEPAGTQNYCWDGGQIRLLTAKMRLNFSKTSRKLKLSSATQTSGKVWGKISFCFNTCSTNTL